MMSESLSKLAVAAVAAGVVAIHALAADVNAERFEKLKALSGEWTAASGDGSVQVTYRVTAAGSAVVETLFPGAPHEMVTVYTLDRGDLVLTHYCAAGNQPHMKAVATGDANAIAFKFDGAGNLRTSKEGHMHEATLSFITADHVKSAWTYYQDGKPGETKEFDLLRKKS